MFHFLVVWKLSKSINVSKFSSLLIASNNRLSSPWLRQQLTCQINCRDLLWHPNMMTVVIVLFIKLANSLSFGFTCAGSGKDPCHMSRVLKILRSHMHTPTHTSYFVHSKKYAKINKLINQMRLQWHSNKSAEFTAMVNWTGNIIN